MFALINKHQDTHLLKAVYEILELLYYFHTNISVIRGRNSVHTGSNEYV